MFRARAREDVRRPRSIDELSVGEPVDVGAGQDALRALEPELGGDGAGGRGVVAGDHLHRDAGRAALGDGRDRLLARRVDEAEQANELEALLHVGERQIARGARQRLRGEGQDALAIGRERVGQSAPMSAVHR